MYHENLKKIKVEFLVSFQIRVFIDETENYWLTLPPLPTIFSKAETPIYCDKISKSS